VATIPSDKFVSNMVKRGNADPVGHITSNKAAYNAAHEAALRLRDTCEKNKVAWEVAVKRQRQSRVSTIPLN